MEEINPQVHIAVQELTQLELGHCVDCILKRHVGDFRFAIQD